MFERFTEPARQVVVFGQDEARVLRHNYIGTEHLLLGLLREGEGLGAQVLGALGVTLDEVRAQVGRIVGTGDEVRSGQIPFTPRSKKVLEHAIRESLALGHNYIGTEHILLGLMREKEGVATRILLDLDLDLDAETVRSEILVMLSAAGYRPPEHTRNPDSQTRGWNERRYPCSQRASVARWRPRSSRSNPRRRLRSRLTIRGAWPSSPTSNAFSPGCSTPLPVAGPRSGAGMTTLEQRLRSARTGKSG